LTLITVQNDECAFTLRGFFSRAQPEIPHLRAKAALAARGIGVI